MQPVCGCLGVSPASLLRSMGLIQIRGDQHVSRFPLMRQAKIYDRDGRSESHLPDARRQRTVRKKQCRQARGNNRASFTEAPEMAAQGGNHVFHKDIRWRNAGARAWTSYDWGRNPPCEPLNASCPAKRQLTLPIRTIGDLSLIPDTELEERLLRDDREPPLTSPASRNIVRAGIGRRPARARSQFEAVSGCSWWSARLQSLTNHPSESMVSRSSLRNEGTSAPGTVERLGAEQLLTGIGVSRFATEIRWKNTRSTGLAMSSRWI